MASPFMRPAEVDLEGSLAPPPASHTAGLARLASMEFSSTDSSGVVSATNPRSPYDRYDLAQQIVSPASAAPTELPAWAPVHSPIDQLISQGTAPPWRSESNRESTLKPLTPWINEAGPGRPRPAALSPPPSATARAWPSASSLPQAAPAAAVDRRQVHSDFATAGDVATAASSAQGGLVGSLTGTSQTMRAASTPRLRAPEPSLTPPARRHFVFQPGFDATTP